MGFRRDLQQLKEERDKVGAKTFWLLMLAFVGYMAIWVALSMSVSWPIDCDPSHHGRFVRLFVLHGCSPHLLSQGAVGIAAMLVFWLPVPLIVYFAIRRLVRRPAADQSTPSNLSVSE